MRTPLTPEQQALAADPAVIHVALQVARRYGRRFRRLWDEFESAAYVALCDAARAYRPLPDKCFQAYVLVRVDGAMRSVCREWGLRGYKRGARRAVAPQLLSLDAPLQEQGSTAIDLIPALQDEVGWELNGVDAVEGLTRCLPRREAAALVLLYCHAARCPLAEAAHALGLSENYVWRLHRRAVQRLAELLPARRSA